MSETTLLDVERLKPGSYTRAKLLKSINGKVPELDPVSGFRLLIAKKPTGHSDTLRKILSNDSQSYKLKGLALSHLGRDGSDEAKKVLLEMLKTDDPRLLAKTAKTLGKIGDKKALEKLNALDLPRTHLAQQDVEFSKKLLSYRHRIDGRRFTTPSESKLIAIAPRGRARLKIENTRLPIAEELKQSVTRTVPGIPVSFERSATIHCREDEFLLVFNEEFKGRDSLLTMKNEVALPLLLLRKQHCPDRYALNHYFFTHPSKRRAGQITLIGTRPTGTVTYSGTAAVDESHFEFSFKVAQNRYVAGLEIEGRFDFDTRDFTFTRALSNLKIDREKVPLRSPKETDE